jgi:hypothetical protein
MEKQIENFYKSLTEKEREAHEIAAKMLGSSYIVVKTHSFIKWQKTNGKTTEQKK